MVTLYLLLGLYAGIAAGEEVVVYTPPLFTINRRSVAAKTIARQNVDTPTIARLHVKTLEIEQ